MAAKAVESQNETIALLKRLFDHFKLQVPIAFFSTTKPSPNAEVEIRFFVWQSGGNYGFHEACVRRHTFSALS